MCVCVCVCVCARVRACLRVCVVRACVRARAHDTAYVSAPACATPQQHTRRARGRQSAHRNTIPSHQKLPLRHEPSALPCSTTQDLDNFHSLAVISSGLKSRHVQRGKNTPPLSLAPSPGAALLEREARPAAAAASRTAKLAKRRGY